MRRALKQLLEWREWPEVKSAWAIAATRSYYHVSDERSHEADQIWEDAKTAIDSPDTDSQDIRDNWQNQTRLLAEAVSRYAMAGGYSFSLDGWSIVCRICNATSLIDHSGFRNHKVDCPIQLARNVIELMGRNE